MSVERMTKSTPYSLGDLCRKARAILDDPAYKIPPQVIEILRALTTEAFDDPKDDVVLVTPRRYRRYVEAEIFRDENSVSIGVGDGRGKLFVYGSYEAVKSVQSFIFDAEKWRRLVNDINDVQITPFIDSRELTNRVFPINKG